MSKLIFFDFLCLQCGHKFEDLIYSHHQFTSCPQCSGTAEKQISPVRIDRSAIALTLGASPESVAHFDRLHRERKAIEERNEATHGDYGKAAGSD